MSSAWSAAHVAAINPEAMPTAPVIGAADAKPVLPDFDVWDMWPIQRQKDGMPYRVDGGIVWMALTAPVMDDPGARHFAARIRLLQHKGDQWIDCGNAMPDGFASGNREWSGSAIIDDDRRVTLFYTAAGGNEPRGYQQRLFQANCELVVIYGRPRLAEWKNNHESVASDGKDYLIVDQQEGAAGTVKAFRDPAYFYDVESGKHYLIFAASLAGSDSAYNGCVGIAVAQDDSLNCWQLLPPLVTADGLNNELERPHILYRGGRYYLFWSTQNSVFAPDGPAGPTGLYGMVARSMGGKWEPLNGNGLVIANPDAQPFQAYSWHVLGDMSVTSFVDQWSAGRDMPTSLQDLRKHFGGTVAPFLYVSVDGKSSEFFAAPAHQRILAK